MLTKLSLEHPELQWILHGDLGGPTIADQFPIQMQTCIGIVPEQLEENERRLILNEGSFSREQLLKFVPIFSKIIPDEELFFSFDDVCLASLAEAQESPLFFSGKITDLPKLFDLPEIGHCPSLYWPKSRSWFVEHNVDVPQAIICGSNDLIRPLSKAIPFDFLEYKPSDRVPQ